MRKIEIAIEDVEKSVNKALTVMNKVENGELTFHDKKKLDTLINQLEYAKKNY